MADPTFTVEQYEALNKSIAQGTLSVRYGDKTVTYRSLDEMLRIRNLIGKELGLLNGNKSSRRYAAFSKNWQKNENECSR